MRRVNIGIRVVGRGVEEKDYGLKARELKEKNTKTRVKGAI